MSIKMFYRYFKRCIIGTCFLMGNVYAIPPSFYTIVGIVDKEAVSFHDVYERAMLVSIFSGQKLSSEILQKLSPQLTSLLMDEALQRKVAHRHKIKVSEKEIQERIKEIEKAAKFSEDGMKKLLSRNGLSMNTLKQQIYTSLVWGKFIAQKYGQTIVVRDQDIDLFKKRFEEDSQKTQYNLAEIVLYIDNKDMIASVWSQALQIMNLVNQGVPFSDVARQFSQSPSRNQGGSIGWSGLGRFDEEVISKIKVSQIGDILGPLKVPTSGDPKKVLILAILDKKEPHEIVRKSLSREEIENVLKGDSLERWARKELEYARNLAIYKKSIK